MNRVDRARLATINTRIFYIRQAIRLNEPITHDELLDAIESDIRDVMFNEDRGALNILMCRKSNSTDKLK